MKSLLPSAPLERIIEDTGDGLKSLRALRDVYLKEGNSSAASRVDTLIGTTAVDGDDPILGELRPLGDGDIVCWDVPVTSAGCGLGA
jgi:hypothetical protein